MPIIDIQKRSRELGRIRIGQTVAATKRDGTATTRPSKLDRFRLTSSSKVLLDKVAELYGGVVQEWQPQGGGPKAWEVVTNSTRLPIMVPPQPVTQWYELWSAAGCIHRCDGITDWQTGDPCDLDSDQHLEAIKKPTTRLNVVLRDVEGIGVWRLETHGWNAAVELPNAAEFLASAGGYVEGWVSLEERVSKGTNAKTGEPETRRFMVPIIEIDVTPAELMAGKGRIQPPALEGPVPRAEIEQGPNVAPPARPDYEDGLARATTREEVTAIWRHARDNGFLTPDLEGACTLRVTELIPPTTEPAVETVDGEIVDGDADAVWEQIVRLAGELNIGLTALQADFQRRMGMAASVASAGELTSYLQILQEQGVDAA